MLRQFSPTLRTLAATTLCSTISACPWPTAVREADVITVDTVHRLVRTHRAPIDDVTGSVHGTIEGPEGHLYVCTMDGMRSFSPSTLEVTARPTLLPCESPVVVGRDVWAFGVVKTPDGIRHALVSAAGNGREVGPAPGSVVFAAMGGERSATYVVDVRPNPYSPFGAYLTPSDLEVVTAPATDAMHIHDGCDAASLGLGPFGTAVACAREGVVTVQSATGGAFLHWKRTLDPHSRYAAPALSPSGHRVAVPRDENIEVYDIDATDGSAPVMLRGALASAEPAWSPDGTMIATMTATRGLGVWDTRTGKQLVARDPDEDYYLFFRWIDGGRKLWVVHATYTMSLWALPSEAP